jgi:hypothetical protein
MKLALAAFLALAGPAWSYERVDCAVLRKAFTIVNTELFEEQGWGHGQLPPLPCRCLSAEDLRPRGGSADREDCGGYKPK